MTMIFNILFYYLKKVTNEVVAIKDIYVERTPLKYLEMEISIMKEINHAYIVKLIDCIVRYYYH